MRVEFTTYVEIEVKVIADYDPGVAPRIYGAPEDCDPGDPGGCEIEAVFVSALNQVRKDILPYLTPGDIQALQDQCAEEFLRQEEGRFEAAMDRSGEE